MARKKKRASPEKPKTPEAKYYRVIAAEEKALARLLKIAKRLQTLRKRRRYYEKLMQTQQQLPPLDSTIADTR